MSGNDFDNVPQCFQIPATEKPGFFAVRSGTDRLPYAGLDARSDALCDRLTAAGIEKDALAGILLDRSFSTITSFLAVLKAGGAFVPLDPSSPPRGILYRTGDLARWHANGEIEYAGRIDHQVKIRGFRIELGEIEARLLAHHGVREAVVSAREGTSGKQLIGYVVAVSGAQEGKRTPAGPAQAGAFVEQLKGHLRASLPDYMIPSRLVVLERMPLTPSGKIDRKALPVPPASFDAEARLEPRASDVEATLAGICARLLNLADVDLDTNFFDLGGTSLDLVALHEEIRERFERNFPVTALFEYSTIRALAARLQTQDPARPPEAGKLPMVDIRDRKLRQNEALQRLGRNRARPAL